jgi:Tfp pilus assembly protein PilX
MRGRQQRGAALVIALVLLVILTLLATAGMRMSIAELVMAGNEQFRHKASTAASAGVEVAIARVAAHRGLTPRNREVVGPVALGEPREDSFTVSIQYTGEETSLAGSSAGKFTGAHFEITSVGTSARNARDEQVQGVMVVSASNHVATFVRAGDGLSQEGDQ